MPVSALQLRTDGSLAPSSDTLAHLEPVGPGDLRLHAKARFLRQDRHFVSVALSGDVTLPTSLGLAYRGERWPTFSPTLVASRTAWGLRVMGNAGLRLRGERLAGTQTMADEITLRAGAGYDVGYHVKKVRLMPFLEAQAFTGTVYPFGVGAGRRAWEGRSVPLQNGLEVLGGVRWEIVDGLQLLGGMSVGPLGGAGVPDYRVWTGLRYERVHRDRDEDRVPDADDRCPDIPEDRDGVSDHDGCPDEDNDGDRIADANDLCPDHAEDLDGFQDDDGCPEVDNDGDGVPDPRDQCPTDAGEADNRGCPETDTDGDGITDALDRCPQQPEDDDGFQDTDGCPDEDDDGDGIPDAADGCPFDAEDKDAFQDEDGCPDPDNDQDTVPDFQDECPNEAAPPDRAALGEGCPDRDQDGDGVMDSVDGCPADAEDKDGFQDEDGCPEPDNDHDGVLDPTDKCPDQPETINGYQDEDGCPDQGPRSLVTVTKEKLVILEKVYFVTAKSTIQKRSFNLLNQVALTILAHPEITEIVVEGHTDSQGTRASNLVLSQKRSESVRKYLVDKGVPVSSLKAVGYGPDRPVGDNKTAAGREQNRRVEFVIVPPPEPGAPAQ
ncbi:MAG: OmpA family protein [Deltaproteobacteria bacterium]|nr:OmpA family protein [Deltaproteobacteria bacterium]